jgi:hypothetical protein
MFDSLPLPVLLAVAGYAYSTWSQIAREHRQGQLERVNEQVCTVCRPLEAPAAVRYQTLTRGHSLVPPAQVKELYGPLLMCITATQSAYDAMCRQHSDGTPESFQAAVKQDPHSVQANAYRDWVREVFMPLNSKVNSLCFHALVSSSLRSPLTRVVRSGCRRAHGESRPARSPSSGPFAATAGGACLGAQGADPHHHVRV